MTGRLVLCSTPIGNLGDASPRLAVTLAEADLVFAEDTRRARKLLTALGVEATVESFFVGNERGQSDRLGSLLAQGAIVALITDAGTPSVSDPGSVAVAAARRVGAEVAVVPGPSAVTAAVAVSGLVDGPFVFGGFLGRKGPERAAQLEALSEESRPTVLFLSPHRATADFEALAAAGREDRQVCVARELTKLHEEVWWGTLGEAALRWSEVDPRGEFTVVVAGAPVVTTDPDEALEIARTFRAEGLSASQAARRAAAETGADRRAIFDARVSDASPLGE
ncbi:16S rRNA (cytidine(1402)-2'-O)-methyltransferase [soil metagenome]